MTKHERISEASPLRSQGDQNLAAGDEGRGRVQSFAAPIDVRQDRATQMMVAFFALLILAIGLSLWFGKFAKNETVRGFVSTPSGLTRVFAAKGGFVTSLSAREGDIVTEGQVVLSIIPGQISSGGSRMTDVERRGLRLRRDALLEEIARINAFSTQIQLDKRMLQSDIAAVLDALERQRTSLHEAIAGEEDRIEKVGKLVKQGYATREKLDMHVRTARDLRRQESELEVKRTQTKREETERLNAIDGLINAKTNARTQFNIDLVDVEARLEFNQTGTRVDVIAPRSGKLSALPVNVGSTLTDGQFVAAIAEPGADGLILRLSVPSSAIGMVAPGQRVILKYDAFPFKTLGIQHGVIQSVALAPSDDPELAIASLPPGGMAGGGGQMPGAGMGASVAPALEAKFAPRQSYFLVTVRPERTSVMAYGVERPIQLGSTLTADIVVERRRLIDWVLDPILAMRGRT